MKGVMGLSNYASGQMRTLRRSRRRHGYCADCGQVRSETYVCDNCKERRDLAKEEREKKRLEQGLCLTCGKHPIDWDNASHALKCVNCFISGPAIRKLKNNTITNKALFKLMQEHACTTYQLAEYVGCTQRGVERWLFEGSQPQLENAIAVCRFFEKEIDEVFPQVVRRFLA